MKINKQLNELIEERNLTAKEISRETGICQSMISQYRQGTEPTPERLQILENFFGISFGGEEKRPARKALKPVREKQTISVDRAAEIMGIGRETLKLALKQDLFSPQIGIAVQHNGSWKYEVFPERMKKYLEGEI